MQSFSFVFNQIIIMFFLICALILAFIAWLRPGQSRRRKSIQALLSLALIASSGLVFERAYDKEDLIVSAKTGMVIDLRLLSLHQPDAGDSLSPIDVTVARPDGLCFADDGEVTLRLNAVDGVFTIIGHATSPQFRYILRYQPNAKCGPVTMLMDSNNLGDLLLYYRDTHKTDQTAQDPSVF